MFPVVSRGTLLLTKQLDFEEVEQVVLRITVTVKRTPVPTFSLPQHPIQQQLSSPTYRMTTLTSTA